MSEGIRIRSAAEFAKAVNGLIAANEREKVQAATNGMGPLDGSAEGYGNTSEGVTDLASFANVTYSPDPIYDSIKDYADGTRVFRNAISAEVVGFRNEPSVVDATNPRKATSIADNFTGTFSGGWSYAV